MKLQNHTLSPEQLLGRSQSLQQEGRLEEAALGFEKLINLYPNFPPVLNSLGTIYLQLGKLKKGCELLDKSLFLDPNQPLIMFNLGLAFQSQNDLPKAVHFYQRAIKLKPDFVEVMNALGIVLHTLKRYKEAISIYQQSIEISPKMPDAYNNLGISLLALNRATDAAKAFEKSISLNPNNPQPYNNLGLTLKRLNKIDKAIAIFNKAISMDTRFADAYSNRGLCFQALGNTEAALRDFNECIKLDSNHADNYWNKSLLKILTGDFKEGWDLYEWRWKSFAKQSVRQFNSPLWLGNESINNKTILIYPEQGYGDYIQCFRYIPMLINLGAKVILEVRPALFELICEQHLNATVIESGNRLPSFDFQCPIMSLPLAFKTQLDSIPHSIPYLSTNSEKAAQWGEALGAKNKTRIGLVWSGSVEHPNDHNRSIGLHKLTPLLELPFEFHSLQKEYREDDLAALKESPIHDHGEKLNAFSDTAALIENLDLVITVDTSVAHLAGAMGKKVMIMLPFNPDYRWMLDRTDTPWYPSANLIRQTKTDDWEGIIIKMTNHLYEKW